MQLTFLIVKIPSAYNTILGQLGLNVLRAVVLTYHMLVQFLTRFDVGEMRGDQMMARQCFLIALKMKELARNQPTKIFDQELESEDEKIEGELKEPLITVLPKKDPKKLSR